MHQEIILNHLTERHSNQYLALFSDSTGKSLVCQAQTSYIPFDNFKSTFEKAAELIAELQVERFIFDKRSLRAFHQPSMEWYFVVWKQAMYRQHGLRLHRKILPAEAWFKKCVEAGRADILQSHPDSLLQKLDIQYTDDITQALKV